MIMRTHIFSFQISCTILATYILWVLGDNIKIMVILRFTLFSGTIVPSVVAIICVLVHVYYMNPTPIVDTLL